MANAPITINLRQRLGLTVRPAFDFKRFQLPLTDRSHQRNRAFRQQLVENSTGPIKQNGSALTYSPHELRAKLGDLNDSTDPTETLRQFHEEQLLRISQLFRVSRDPAVTAEQAADLRHCLVSWAFRLAARENEADLALLIGGSAANGVHTFQTDLDFVVMPHAPEDRDAARNVQNLMAGLLTAIGIEADWVMPRHFEYNTFNELGRRYGELIEPSETDRLLNGFMFQASASFFRFLMDVRVVDAVGRREGSPDISAHQASLDQLKDRLVFSVPDHLIEQCVNSFSGTRNAAANDQGYLNIKNDPIRLFHYALYASRARLGVRESNFWRVIDRLQEQGVLSAAEVKQARQALRLFIGLRHLIGLSVSDALDSSKLTETAVAQIAQRLGETPERLMEVVQEQRSIMNGISRLIFERIGSPLAD